MNKRYIPLLIVLLFLSVFTGIASGQDNEGQRSGRSQGQRRGNKIEAVTIKAVVKDANGKPIPGVLVSGKEGAIEALSGADGQFSITVPKSTDLLFEADGYETKSLSLAENIPTTVNLTSTPFLMGDKDKVNIAFGQVKRRDLVGAVSTVDPKQLKKTDDTENIYDALLGKVPGLLGNSNIRGLGSALIIVDGIPRDPSNLNLSEVEQITVLKDGNAAMLWGSQAKNGVILITTRRGQALKRKVEVSVEKGFQAPAALPHYLGSADYMKLYNEARGNDGLSPLYADSTIAHYAQGNSPYRYPNVDYYGKEFLKSQRPTMRILSELSGGNENTQYYANVGWTQTGTLYNLGDARFDKDNRFNMRANVDFKVNDYIKSSIDAVMVFDQNKMPNGNFWSNAATYQPQYFSPLLPINLIENTAANRNQVKPAAKINSGYLLGGTQQYTMNPYGNMFLAGDSTAYKRNAGVNATVEADLRNITPGLKFRTYLSFDIYNRYSVQVINQYAVYAPTWQSFGAAGDSIQKLNTAIGKDVSTGVQNMPIGASNNPQTMWFERSLGAYAMFDYNRTFNNVHTVSATLLGYWDKYHDNAVVVDRKDAHVGLRVDYDYKQKYMVDFSSTYTNGFRFAPGHMGGYAPSLGLGWVISEEDWMKNCKGVVDFLKLRASAAIQNIDPALGTEYRPYGESFAWGVFYNFNDNSPARQTRSVTLMRAPNYGLTFEKMKTLNAGFEGYFFNRLLYVDANVFQNDYAGQVIRKGTTLYPYWIGNMNPYENYNETRYRGAELGATLNKSFGKFSVQLGGNLLWNTSKVIQKSELYGYDYMYRTGKSADAIFGLVSKGLFQDATDIANSPKQKFSTAKPGDIKYEDINKDGVVDGNDQVQIGNSQAKFGYGLNLVLKYANLSIMAQGDGQQGFEYMNSNPYIWIQSSVKYSEVANNRWTPATAATATIPRLSSGGNSNNYQNSTFWLMKGDYFRLNRLQVTYDVPKKIIQNWATKEISLYVRGSNVWMWSTNQYNRQLNIGLEPNYRSYALGVNVLF